VVVVVLLGIIPRLTIGVPLMIRNEMSIESSASVYLSVSIIVITHVHLDYITDSFDLYLLLARLPSPTATSALYDTNVHEQYITLVHPATTHNVQLGLGTPSDGCATYLRTFPTTHLGRSTPRLGEFLLGQDGTRGGVC
jgi:hypothetical protein